MPQKLRFAQSGRKHRVAMHRVRAVMHHSGCPEVDENTGALYFTGRDTKGRLHHIGVRESRETDQLLIIFHAQPVGVVNTWIPRTTKTTRPTTSTSIKRSSTSPTANA